MPLLDLLRGSALIGMTVFHFAYDLELFGLRESGYADQPHWYYLATSVAATFLFLTGVSLYLAHAAGIRWKRWRRRLAYIVLSALAVTVATWYVTPKSFIFFGILHMIALASVTGLVFVRSPWWLSVAAAIAVLAIDKSVHSVMLNAPVWHWTGLSNAWPVASDYRPMFPWLAPALLGIGAAKWLDQAKWLRVLAIPRLESKAGQFVRFLGRNSLAYYLLHQPVMIAVLWTGLQLANPM